MKNLIARCLIQRVSFVGPVDCQCGNAATRLDKNVLIYHASFHYMETEPELVPIKFLPPRVDVERRNDGTLVLRSPEPLRPYARCVGEFLERWAAEKPDDVFLAERDGDEWRKLTWAETRRQVRVIAASLVALPLSADHPVAVLSDNSIEHALIALAAMHIGVPVAPISPAYSLMSRDFAKLKTVIGLIQPHLIFIDDRTPYERALAAINLTISS